MAPSKLLQIAAELRIRAEAATAAERADLLYLAEEYEASARNSGADKVRPFTVEMPR